MAIIPQQNLFSWDQIETTSDLDKLSMVLEILPDEKLIREMELSRKKRRDDYPIAAIWNSLIAGIIYQHPSIESLRRELKRNAQLREMCGFNIFKGEKGVPPKYVYTRFLKKLIKLQVEIDKMFHVLIESLQESLPDLGRNMAIDGKAINSHSCGKKESTDSSDPEADWGKKSYKGINNGKAWEKIKSWFGYNLHLIVDTKYELPLGYELTKASVNDTRMLIPMVEEMNSKHPEMINKAEIMTADKGYDSEKNNKKLFDDYGIKPVIDIRNMWYSEKDSEITTKPLNPETVDNIVYDYKGNVYCHLGEGSEIDKDYVSMAFKGFEADRNCLKYQCPAATYGIECSKRKSCGNGNYGETGRTVRIPLETDRRIFTPIARSSYKFDRIYKDRTAVERVNSRIDNVYGFEKHFIRGKAKMTMRISLSLVIMLAMAVGRIKMNAKEDMRSLVMPLKAAA